MSGHRVTFIGGTLDGFQRVYDDPPKDQIYHAVMRAPGVVTTGPDSYRPSSDSFMSETYRIYMFPGPNPAELIYVAVLDGESAAPERKVPDADDEICCANCGCNPATGQPYDPEPRDPVKAGRY